ncbi:MAG: DUF1573 domain-containing protein [Prolixibacteraceae bacterium]
MNKLIFILITLSLFSFALQAQEGQAAQNDSIIFNKLVHDYGTIEKGGDGNCEFVFTNKGQKPLVLSNVRASCGCTVPQWPREPIAPGEQGKIKVKYNTKTVGSFNKSVTVNSNAANNVVILRVKGQVVAP